MKIEDFGTPSNSNKRPFVACLKAASMLKSDRTVTQQKSTKEYLHVKNPQVSCRPVNAGPK